MITRINTNHKFVSRRHSRQGITLLFVVSMIVLFLLMGTTFMIVANDFRRDSRPRAVNDIYSIDDQALVQQAFYELIRGPELSNPGSPLRTHDILADMYGYGFKAEVTTAVVANVPGSNTSANGFFVELELEDPDDGTANQVLNLLSGDRPGLPVGSGFFNGRVISFITQEAQGVSTRILDYQVDGTEHKFIIQLPSRLERGDFALGDLVGSEVIINGRAFSGTGAGEFNQGASIGMAALTEMALQPNRVGESLFDLIGNNNPDALDPASLASAYLSFQRDNGDFNISGNLTGPNESYDGPDYQNMYLSGVDLAGNPIASFHRRSLGATGGNTNAGSPTNRHMFSAFNVTGNQLQVDTDLDGTMDAVWIDIGLPVQTTPDGLRYRPLVAYRVVDQDGRINLNLAGNLSDQINNTSLENVRGEGYGPAELAVGATEFLSADDYRRILQGGAGLPGRYGFDLVPGAAGTGAAGRDSWSEEKLFGYPETDSTGNLFASSAVNIRGRFSPRFPLTQPVTLQDLNFNVNVDPDSNYNNALPQMDFTTSEADIDLPGTDTMVNSPYEANFAPNHLRGWQPGDDDALFSPLELERLLRLSDVDSNLLPGRLVTLAAGVAGDAIKRNSVTTESYEVPMSPGLALSAGGNLFSLSSVLRQRLDGGGNVDLATDPDGDNELQDELVREYLSREFLVGLKMDINRVFGDGLDNNNNGIFDEPGEATDLDLNGDLEVNAADRTLARYNFAKQLYVLMLLTTKDSLTSLPDPDGELSPIENYRRAVAQWCVNVVDFRDADSIHTGFEFDLNPWNGWTVDGDISSDLNDNGDPELDRAVVWGAERPELLLTESFSAHDRRNQDTAMEPGGMTVDDPDEPDEDFDSRFIPQNPVFLELYNPWTMTAENQELPAELGDGTGVDLQAVSPNDEPVWRINFKRDATDDNPVRSVVFTNAAPSFDTPADQEAAGFGSEIFFTSINNNVPMIGPGEYAVIGSVGNVPEDGGQYRTTFGRLAASTDDDLMLDGTRSITLVPGTGEVIRNEWDRDSEQMEESTFPVSAVIVIDQPRSLSVSDPRGGYDGMDNSTYQNFGDGLELMRADENTPVFQDLPFDVMGLEDMDDAAIWTNSTTDNYRAIELQRLANPLLAWNADTNPYLTIDVASLDLTSYNGLTNNPNNNGSGGNDERMAGLDNTVNNTDLGSLQRGEADAAEALPFARDRGAQDRGGERIIPQAGGQTDGHNLSHVMNETFGRPNAAFLNGQFTWLTWNNRPYVSHLELMNVPRSAPEDLTTDFSIQSTEDPAPSPYTTEIIDADEEDEDEDVVSSPLKSKFGHLLNFYGDGDDDSSLASFYRLLDFVEVPSRYVGTEQWLNPEDVAANPFTAPFDFVSYYRYPGKININTIPNNQVFNVLMGDYANMLSYADFNASRWRGTGATAFFRPYRNTAEGNLVASSVFSPGIDTNVDAGLLRRDGSGEPLFENEAGAEDNRNQQQRDLDMNNSARNGYFENAMRQRLGNLVTTRSSVFAIWITVGYFEVDQNDDLVNIAGGGNEVGLDDGTAVRNRGFYLFDRSIPVAYEPGKNHNIERAILVQSIIE